MQRILRCTVAEQISLVLVKGTSAMLVTAPWKHWHLALAIPSYVHAPLSAGLARQGNQQIVRQEAQQPRIDSTSLIMCLLPMPSVCSMPRP